MEVYQIHRENCKDQEILIDIFNNKNSIFYLTMGRFLKYNDIKVIRLGTSLFYGSFLANKENISTI